MDANLSDKNDVGVQRLHPLQLLGLRIPESKLDKPSKNIEV